MLYIQLALVLIKGSGRQPAAEMESGMCPGLEDGQREGEREGKGRDGDVHQPEQHYIYSILGFFFSLCSSKT